ncbi:hypothetical protein PENSTE_c001G02882 [Penicillium steckii]|uniref:Uncharacterized protein n=1 Tax=Penicillium steckii TaxID=303698 RepID=A0A1V6U0B0_9EURO|nr:hypothetical protein PENSTE_c001G02882 [Penicillium steckii]
MATWGRRSPWSTICVFVDSNTDGIRSRYVSADGSLDQSICLAVGVCLLCAVMTGIDAVKTLDRPRDGAVAIDWKCNPFHVNVSPWRYYLDIEDGLPVRVARMWFNS